MVFQFQETQQRIFSLLIVAVVIVVAMTVWSYAWAQYFDLGTNEPKEALEVAGFALLVQFFLCLPYLYFKRYFLASLLVTSLFNGFYLFWYWSNSTPLCCGVFTNDSKFELSPNDNIPKAINSNTKILFIIFNPFLTLLILLYFINLLK